MLDGALMLARLRGHPGRSLVLVEIVAVAAGAVPALLARRVPTSQALAVE